MLNGKKRVSREEINCLNSANYCSEKITLIVTRSSDKTTLLGFLNIFKSPVIAHKRTYSQHSLRTLADSDACSYFVVEVAQIECNARGRLKKLNFVFESATHMKRPCPVEIKQ